MDYTTLGRTGLKVSVMGVGCGGPSRIGQRKGIPESESASIIRQALDAGVNFIDTAEAYRTEGVVGAAMDGIDRASVVVSTKKGVFRGITATEVEKGLEASLKRLGTDYVDIYNLHGVALDDYDYLCREIVPVLRRMQQQGKLRFLGITEGFNADPGHKMLVRALDDDIWDVMMVGFNILNQSARDRVFPKTIEKNIGVQIMFAVRLALSRPDRLKGAIEQLIDSRQIDPKAVDPDDPLGFLVHDGGADSIVDAAYRLCRDEPGTHVILSGTGNPEHMVDNIASFLRPPLPQQDIDRLKRIFRSVDSITGQ